MTLHTPRFLLVPATAALVRLELRSQEALGCSLAADVPADWPPEELADALPWFLAQLEVDSSLSGWLGWYGLCRRAAEELPLLVGSGGFFGYPEAGVVEIGYSVLPQFQGKGYATEIVAGLVTWAFSQPSVHRVVAETKSENMASLRVLAKLGFLSAGAGREVGSLRFERGADGGDGGGSGCIHRAVIG